MWPRAAALAYRCWGEGKDFESYFAERKPLLEKLDVTIRDVDPLKRAKIAHLGIGPYYRGFDTASMMEALEKSAVAGEVAHDF